MTGNILTATPEHAGTRFVRNVRPDPFISVSGSAIPAQAPVFTGAGYGIQSDKKPPKAARCFTGLPLPWEWYGGGRYSRSIPVQAGIQWTNMPHSPA